MSISKGILKVRSGSSFVEFHPETESALITDFRTSVRDNLPINVYKSSKAYAVGDCVFHEDLPTWAYLRCTQAGTTASTMPNTISKSATLDLVITDGTVKWTVSKYGVPIDAKLKSIIAQNVVKDSLLYGTGANTFALTTLSELGRQLISQATAANMRSKLSAAASSHSHATSDITNFASQVISSIGSETLAALGVSYSITTNGYICFGSLFGGLILQWAHLRTEAVDHEVVDAVHIWPRLFASVSRPDIWTRGLWATPVGTAHNKINFVKAINYDGGGLTPQHRWQDYWRFYITRANSFEISDTGDLQNLDHPVPYPDTWVWVMSLDTIYDKNIDG